MRGGEDQAERGPPLHALRAFEAAARHESFTRAADELGVSPAAVSQHVQQVEEFAGQPLFRRLTRKVELTDAGAASARLLKEAMALIQEANRIMRLPLRQQRVSVSAAPSFAAKWLVARLEQFKDKHPEIEVWLSADMAVVDFARADVDLAIRYGPGGYAEAQFERLLAESVSVVCSPRLLQGGDGLMAPPDLARFDLLHDESPDRDPSCPSWPMWLAARGLDHIDGRRGLRLSHSSLVIDAAIAGKGVALAKTQLAAADIAAGRLVAPFALAADPVHFAYWMVWPRGRTQTPALRAFMDWLRETAASVEADLGAGI